ncbi:hypothetical protein ACH4Q6_33195 [Streptomyces lydicus]|uniref:hypothetical protein n=1 Tax=Streptomyces lydicus TaxID=47763 RepID=UPI00378777AC
MAYESSVLYRAGTEGHTSFRIPAVVRARSGTVPAVAEGRVSSAADRGDIDLVRKRSRDGGRTGGPLQVVARDQAEPPRWRRYATGPGHALRLRHGPHVGRPLVPANPFRHPAGLAGPVCQGSTLSLPDHGTLLFSGPAHPAARALLTLRAGRDGGLTRPAAQPVSGLPAACSDLVRLDRDTVGLLHETGDSSAYSTITFRRIPVEEPR